MTFFLRSVVPDDECCDSVEHEKPSGACTPQTPPVVASPSRSAPSAAPSSSRRHRAMAQPRPVSLPEVVKQWLVKIPFDHWKILTCIRCLTDGHLDPENSARGNDGAHHSDLKRNAECISRSLSEVFVFLTNGTASLIEDKRQLTITTNVLKVWRHSHVHYLSRCPAHDTACFLAVWDGKQVGVQLDKSDHAMKSSVAKLQYNSKRYTAFKPTGKVDSFIFYIICVVWIITF